ENTDVLINLAGRSVNCRYGAHNRRAILESRIESTRLLGETIRQLIHPPRLWMNASTATIYRHALDRPMDEAKGETGGTEREGPVNLASPNPLPNNDFMRSLRAAWGTRVGLPVAKWMLELGAFALRTESELILKSRRVVPGRLVQSGFEFHFPEWQRAAEDLVERWRTARQ